MLFRSFEAYTLLSYIYFIKEDKIKAVEYAKKAIKAEKDLEWKKEIVRAVNSHLVLDCDISDNSQIIEPLNDMIKQCKKNNQK